MAVLPSPGPSLGQGKGLINQKFDQMDAKDADLQDQITEEEAARAAAVSVEQAAREAADEYLQTQLNAAVFAGDSSVAAAQAAVDTDGFDHGNLKVRIDYDYNRTAAQLADLAEEVGTKARQSSLDAETAQRISAVSALQTGKINKGQVTVADIDKNLGKIDQSYLTDDLLQQIAGTTPVNAVPAPYSVTVDKLAFTPVLGVAGINLFNKKAVTAGKYVQWDNGSLADNGTYAASDWIPVKSSTYYAINQFDQTAFYDSAKTYISGIDEVPGGNKIITSPANAEYLRISVALSRLPTLQVEQGSSVTDYADYRGVQLNQETIVGQDNLVDGVLVGTPSKNLFEKKDVTTGVYVQWDNGSLADNGTYAASDWIPVKSSTYYAINQFDQTAFYDSAKTYISGIDEVPGSNKIITTPPNTAYMRISVALTRLETLQVEAGSAVTTYQPAGLIFFDAVAKKSIDNAVSKFKTIQSIMTPIRLNAGLQIKLIGDSITQGMGGTGFAEDGAEIMPGWHVNTSGHCWANSLRDYLQSKFVCTVKNYGCSGINSWVLMDSLDQLIEPEDDIVICMIGTNDRNTDFGASESVFYDDLIVIGEYVREQGKEFIFMSSIPASVANEVDGKSYHMEDVDHIVMAAANYFNMEYISLYKTFMNYCNLKDISIDTLLADGLHPNDQGYDIIFNIVTDHLGIARKRPGATW